MPAGPGSGRWSVGESRERRKRKGDGERGRNCRTSGSLGQTEYVEEFGICLVCFYELTWEPTGNR